MLTSLMIMLSTTLIASSIIFMTTPMQMGLLILTLALLITSSTALFSTSWLALLTFLIYISGMLVLFAYFVSISPNQAMKLSIFPTLTMLPTITLIFMMFWNSAPPLTLSNNWFMMAMYFQSSTIILIILALALLLTMIIVVKLTMLSKGPLRPFLNYV